MWKKHQTQSNVMSRDDSKPERNKKRKHDHVVAEEARDLSSSSSSGSKNYWMKKLVKEEAKVPSR